ncbi:MAG: RNA-binding protein [Geminicoccales bacterium]
MNEQTDQHLDIAATGLETAWMATSNPPAERRCLVTRSTDDRERLIRFVVGPVGDIVPDVDERLPGRGMWLSAGRDVLNKAIDKRLFGRVAGQSVKIGANLAEQVEGLLTRRFYDTLGLSRRAGQLVMGFEKVQATLEKSGAGLLLQADDGAVDGRRKLRHLASDLPLVTAGSRDELGSAVGRESLVHAALPSGKLANRVLRDALRLAGFRSDIAVEGAVSSASDRTEPKGTTEKP